MTEFALENAKLIMLSMLIGAIIGLSHLKAPNLAELRAAIAARIARGFAARAKSAAPAH